MLAPTANLFVHFFSGLRLSPVRNRSLRRLETGLLTPHLKRDIGLVDHGADGADHIRAFDLIRLNTDRF